MEKTKKRLISSALVTAIILVVVICGLVFGQSVNVVEDAAFSDVQSDGVITGVYSEIEDAQAYYQDLITNQDYTSVDSQDEFNKYFASGETQDSGKYALNPSVEFTAQSAKYLKNVIIDGCGAKVNLSINAAEAFSDTSTIGSNSQTGIAELGLSANTMFYWNPISKSELVYIKPYGGLADYAVNTTIRNVDFNLNSATASHSYESFGSVLIGGVFGIMSNSSVSNCNFTTAIKIDKYTFKLNPHGGGAFDGDTGMRSRPYDLALSFGSLAGYMCECTVSDVSLYIDPDTIIYLRAEGKTGGWYSGDQGNPRVAVGGLIGIAQNNNTIRDIAISGAGTLIADPSDQPYYEVTGSAKLGIAGGLVGIVSDSENQNEYFMLKSEGHTHIYNIVSTWSGSISMWGIVYGTINYTVTGITGSLVGIKGKYAYGENTAASPIDTTYLHGVYKLYSGDALPTGNVVSYSYAKDATAAVTEYSAAGLEFSNIRIREDGQEWLNITGDKKVDIGFSDTAFTLTYDVTDSVNTAANALLWSYSQTVISGGISTTQTIETWKEITVDGNKKVIGSFEDSARNYTVSIGNTTVTNTTYDFTTGYSAYYRVQGEGEFSSQDKLQGTVGTRVYNVKEREYNGNAPDVPVVELYKDSSYQTLVASSTNADMWTAQKNGSGSFNQLSAAKDVNDWYLSLVNTESTTAGYLYNATASDGKNYVAYKADNAIESQDPSLNGTPITTRYYVYKITQKVITPSIVDKTADELIYDNAAKVFTVNFGDQIYAGDTVTPTLVYYSVNGDEISSAENATDVGSYKVVLTKVSNGNYTLPAEEISKNFAITKRVLTSTIGTTTEFTYNGHFQTPGVTIGNQIAGVEQSAVVSVTYRRNGAADSSGNVGEYTMTVDLTTIGKKNYELTGELEKTYNINKALLEYTGLDVYTFSYDSIGVDYDKMTSITENPIAVGNAAIGETFDYTVYFRPYVEGDDSFNNYETGTITDAGEYDCIIYVQESNYEEFRHKIKIVIEKSVATINVLADSGTPDENGSYDYNGKEVSFKVSYSGIGYVDEMFLSFETKIYPAVYESGAWKKVEGSEGVSSVVNAGDYIVVVEQTSGLPIDENPNYDTITNPGTREMAFTIRKATLTWIFSGEGLDYHEDSGEYYAEYNGQTFTLSLESGDLESQLVEGDKGKYSLTGKLEYICETQQGDYSVGTKGVRDAGYYRVEPEVNCGENPALSVNYEIKGGKLAITQRPVTIVIKDISVPYGTNFDEITGESFSNMWSYAPDSKKFLPEDGNLLTFYLRDVSMEETLVRGSYPYTFLPSLINPNANNYQIFKENEGGDNSYCTVTGLELKVEVVVTDKDGNEVEVKQIESGKSYETSAIYYGGDYTVTLRATNANPDVAVSWATGYDSYAFRNVADGKKVTFMLSDEANQVYYIGEDLSVTDQPDGVFDVTFSVNARTVEITPSDVEVAYGNEFTAAGSTLAGDGFVDGEQDWFTYAYTSELGATVGSTADINVVASVIGDHSGAENNYNFVYKTGTATRIARVLHVTLTDREKVYGSEVLLIGEEFYSFAQGESVVGDDVLGLAYVLTKDGEIFADAVNLGVGEYALSATASNSNYSIEIANEAKFTVNPKKADVELAQVSVPYDMSEHPITVVSITGLIEGDEEVTVNVQYLHEGQTIEGAPVNKGVYTANVIGFSSPNYSVGEVTGTKTVEITNIVVNVTVLDAVMAYGTGNIVPAGEAFFTSDSPLFDADDLDPYYIYNNGEGDTTGLSMGSYANSLTLGFNGAAAENYDITITNTANLTVEKANLAEVANLENDSDVYDGNGKTVTVLGVQTDQVNISITKDGAAVESVVDAGEYTVTVTANSENYEGTATLTYTVAKAAFDGTLSKVTSVYDGKAVDLASLVDSKYGEVVFTITLNGEIVASVLGAGEYIVTLAAGENSNYTGSVEGLTYTVTKAVIATPTTRNDFNIVATSDSITFADKNGKHAVLVTMTDGDWDGATNAISGLKPETEYTVYVKFAGDDNYIESGVFKMTVETGAKVASVLDPDDVTYTVYYNKIVVTVKGNGSYAYSSDGGKTWKDSNTLTGLKAGTEYTVAVKIKESEMQGESNVVTRKLTTGTDPASFNKLFDAMGETLTAADLDSYDAMIEAYEALADGDKANVDKTKLDKLQTAYNALIAEVNGDVIAAQNVARKAAGKGVAAAAAGVLAAVIAAIVAKKKFVF